MQYHNCWLTLNRSCNLRCKWCYARDTKYLKNDDISLENAFKIIDLCEKLNIKHITLMGGEPTLYPHIFDVLDYCKKKEIRCGIVTNGIQLANIDYLQKLIDHRIGGISLSLKGEDATSFFDVTGFDDYEIVLKAIQNLVLKKCKFAVSMVLTEKNIPSYLIAIKNLKELGVNHFHFSFCYEMSYSEEYKETLKKNNPKIMIREFCKTYHELDQITQHQFNLFNGLPLCIWPQKYIRKMREKGQIISVCQLLKKSGLIFDSQGNLIPCNAMTEIKIGKIDEDFTDFSTFLQHIEKKEFKGVYDTLTGLPSEKCLQCKWLPYCGGGCVCQWTNYSFEELMGMK